MVIKRLPQFAEHHFASLCATAGVVCNASDQDECGWDFFLQYPIDVDPKRPADMQPDGPEALVQVKSTRNGPLVARMKLSNALRAVRANQPYFVVLVVPDAQAPRVYVRHFWHAEIERTLRRVRVAERQGDTLFNRRHFDIRMGEADVHDDVLGWMRSAIASVKPSYAVEKRRIAGTVGHEDGFGSMDVTFDGTEDDLLDLQLGLIESLPVTRARFVPERFGIPAPKPQIDVADARLFVEPDGRAARLRLQGGSPTEELFVDAKFYGASLPVGKVTRFRWRVDAAPLTMIGGEGGYSAKMSMRTDERRPLAALVFFLTMAGWRAAGPVGCHLFLDDQIIPLGTLNLDAGEEQPAWGGASGGRIGRHDRTRDSVSILRKL